MLSANSKKVIANRQNELKRCCVTRRGDKYYYPPTIPKERSNLTKYLSIATCIILLTVDGIFISSLDFWTFIVFYLCGFLGNVVIHILYRLILIWEEIKHVKSRYNNSYKTILTDAFTFSREANVMSFVAILIVIWKGTGREFPIMTNKSLPLFAAVIFLLGKIFKLEASPLYSSLQISEINGLDYGSGMAYSFYNGYLKLILKETGTADKSLRDLMDIYESQHGIKFEVYKLFILIPLSLRCFVSLKNDFSPSVDESVSLPEKQITVAGVQNRVYKNAVYKIECGGNIKKYVAAEYATPLKTFNDVVNSPGEHANFYRKHKNEICLQFFLTLQRVLKATKGDEICELIFFDDQIDDTRYHDVGQILLTRLKDLKKNGREKLE